MAGKTNGRDADDAMDADLFKRIGLHQLLWPPDRGGGGRRYRTAILSVLRLTFGLQLVQTVRLYWALDDVQQFLFLASVLVTGLMCVFKGYVMVTSADRLRRVLDAAGRAYTLSGLRDPSELRRCRRRLSVWLRAFVALSYGTLAFWNAAPWCARSDRSPAVWTLVYVTESFVLTVNVFCWLLFDCYFVTVAFALRAQFLTVAAGYGHVGHGHVGHGHVGHGHVGHGRRDRPLRPSAGIRAEGDESESDCHYDDLIIHVEDNQKLIQKYDDFFDIVRPVVLLQVAQGACESMTLVLLTSFAYLTSSSIVSPPVLKFASGFASLTFELYIFCYALDILETAKTMINFGLYSSNWTAMNLKFKKTLLLIMNMNTAHMRVMKVSPKSNINLEMFARVMNMSYSIVSVILKTKRTNET